MKKTYVIFEANLRSRINAGASQGFVEKMGLTSTPLHFARYKLLAPKNQKPCKKAGLCGEDGAYLDSVTLRSV
jgi:hypothetical protein